MKILVIDSGIGLQHAITLKEEGNEVFYFVPWQSPYPKFSKYIIGYGFVEKILDPMAVFEEVDFVVITDSGWGDLADYMRQYKPVFGGGLAEELESDRVLLKEVLKDLGLKTPPYKVIQGVSDLIKYGEEFFASKKNKRLFVKINLVRGDVETFGVSSVEELKTNLFYVASKFGPFADTIEFVVEEGLEGDFVEVGIDTFFNGEDFIPEFTYGLEIKTHTLVKVKTFSVYGEVLTKIKPVLEDYGYVGPFSMEALYDGKDLYLTDFTIRFPYPISMMFPLYIQDYTKFLYDIARGEKPSLNLGEEYYGTANVYIDYDAHDRWLKLNWEEKDNVRVAVRSAIKSDEGEIYAIPIEGESLVLTLVAKDNDIENLFLKLSEYYNNFVSIPTVDIKGNFSSIFNQDVEKLKEFGESL